MDRSVRVPVLVLVSTLLGLIVMVAQPSGAHINKKVSHVWKHIRAKADARYLKLGSTAINAQKLDGFDSTAFATLAALDMPDGTINQPADLVDWTKLKNVPADLTDGDATGGTADDIDCAGCVNTADLAGGEVTEAKLAFGAATQDELDTHKASSDHDNQYFTETELSTNGGGSAVHWNNLTNVPAGLGDGDDVAGLDRAGFTMSTLDATGTLVGYISAIMGSDGLPVVSYFDEGDDDLKVAHCDDAACTSWTTSTPVSAGDVGRFNSLTIQANGFPAISYRDNNGRLAVGLCADVVCSSATPRQLETVNITGQGTSIAVGVDGLLVMSQYYESFKDLRVTHCDDATCTSATNTDVDAAGGGSPPFVGSDNSITIGGDGLPLVSYFDESGGDLEVAHCTNVACTASTLSTLDSSGSTGSRSSITTGQDGLGLITYYDTSAGEVNVAHCDDATCSTATLASVAPSPAMYPSISIGADGLGVIALPAINGDLRFAHCSNVACSSSVVTTLDTTVDVEATSVMLGSDGLPVVVYYEGPTDTLRLVHCSNVLCTPYFRRR